MDWNWVWKAVLIVFTGTLLLRVAGRKSISQMTLAQTVIMIGIGSLLVQPVAGKNIWTTILVGSVLVLTLIIMEYAQIKSGTIEKLITGKSQILVEDGILNEKNLRKLRMTVDQLEMNLRQLNVASISDLKWATLGPNGQVGYELKPEAQPATKKEIQLLHQDIKQVLHLLGSTSIPQIENQKSSKKRRDIFKEVDVTAHEQVPPKHLQ
ncbi:MAG TPA: DUF421 domain-containing protein [Chondromyces sp.]|nr:DUF421 domain-containing protein [Chondromyces sp.]